MPRVIPPRYWCCRMFPFGKHGWWLGPTRSSHDMRTIIFNDGCGWVRSVNPTFSKVRDNSRFADREWFIETWYPPQARTMNFAAAVFSKVRDNSRFADREWWLVNLDFCLCRHVFRATRRNFIVCIDYAWLSLSIRICFQGWQPG